MAPEFPPRLIVFTHENDSANAHIENVETPGPGRLRVRWSDLEPPAGYRSVAGGALYVEDGPGLTIFERDVKLDSQGGRRFAWTQGTPEGIPWLMIALILPPGFTLGPKTRPPESAKEHNGRLAVYWCLRGDDLGRVTVDWSLAPLDRSLEEEVQHLNSLSSLDALPPTAQIEIETPARAPKVFLCHSSKDKPRVRELYGRLERDGFAPWLDEVDILPGEEWEPAIRKAVRASDVVLVCLSQSVSRPGYLQKEITFVLDVAAEQPEGAIFLIPLRFDDVPVPERLSKLQWLNYFQDGAHERLLAALRKRASQLQAHS